MGPRGMHLSVMSPQVLFFDDRYSPKQSNGRLMDIELLEEALCKPPHATLTSCRLPWCPLMHRLLARCIRVANVVVHGWRFMRGRLVHLAEDVLGLA